jgi:hypothetical protein
MRTYLAAALVVALTGGGVAVAGPASAASTVYEAEQATVVHGTVDADHTGYTGTGFVNSTNETGAYVEFAVHATAAGSAGLTFRYANGTTADRPGAVSLNGAVAATPAFTRTANWDTWAATTVTVSLAAGPNLVRVTSTTAGGLPNLDSLTVSDGPAGGGVDWSDALVDSTMRRFTPSSVGGWSYPVALYLMGQYDIATDQLVVYASHLQQPNGLLKHAYDESRTASWADPSTGLAPEYWCRAVGWFGVAAIQVLDLIPPDHPRRARLVSILQNLVRGLAAYQDPASGRWFQVVDKGGRGDNWTETSCSAMYTYTVDAAVKRGYVPASYQSTVDAGRAGEVNRISLHSDGLTYLTTVSIGTNVGDYAYYIGRTQATNDFHGLGAFLFFAEESLH